MLKFTCSKLYDNIPIAHRQQNHTGHCSKIHGHDWSFHFTFACNDRDPVTGFVVDFGDLKDLRAQIEKFDHALAVNKSDTELAKAFIGITTTGLSVYDFFMPVFVEDCTCEGFAAYFFNIASGIIHAKTGGRAWVESVTVEEGRVNSATVYDDNMPAGSN